MQNISVTLRTYLTLTRIKWVLGDPSSIFLATIFADKMSESSGFMYSFILLLGNMTLSFYLKRNKFTRNCEFVPIQLRSLETRNWNKFHRRNTWNLSFLALFKQQQLQEIYCLGPCGPNTKLYLQCDFSFRRNIQSF